MSNDFYFPRSFDLPFPDPRALNAKEQCVQIQYDLPKRLNHYANKYPFLSWSSAQTIYKNAVQEVLLESGEKDLLSGKLSFGRGYELAERKFIEIANEYYPIELEAIKHYGPDEKGRFSF